ncbi:hypothetical protein [Rhizobium leguminosarum]|uniref:hypothetical protein n=1 Tax=Rhizobium leguminosarum TaxID=384 RepID=UPI00161762E6|nr:hypothetical protein [Rhizobium leguminosarum]MBB4342109.1 hypothetical protein [Rhizobium leguminosarum]MBB6294733.1 hypothetical protein [Rhizobium leguminosarum]
MEDPKEIIIRRARAEEQVRQFVAMLFGASINRSISKSRTIALKATTAAVTVWSKKGGAA